jgi:hypothetical protein
MNKLSLKSQKLLREKFFLDYCKKKGWNPKELSPSQLIELVNQKEYKNPDPYKLYFK